MLRLIIKILIKGKYFEFIIIKSSLIRITVVRIKYSIIITLNLIRNIK